MASASGRGDSYTLSNVRHSSRHRTPPSRDERQCYPTPEQAGRGGGQIGVAGKSLGGSNNFPLSLHDSFLYSQQASLVLRRRS